MGSWGVFNNSVCYVVVNWTWFFDVFRPRQRSRMEISNKNIAFHVVDHVKFHESWYGWLGGGNSNIFYVHPTWGNDPIWRAYFSNGLVETTNYMMDPYKWWISWYDMDISVVDPSITAKLGFEKNNSVIFPGLLACWDYRIMWKKCSVILKQSKFRFPCQNWSTWIYLDWLFIQFFSLFNNLALVNLFFGSFQEQFSSCQQKQPSNLIESKREEFSQVSSKKCLVLLQHWNISINNHGNLRVPLPMPPPPQKKKIRPFLKGLFLPPSSPN